MPRSLSEKEDLLRTRSFGQLFRSFSLKKNNYSPQSIKISDLKPHTLTTTPILRQPPSRRDFLIASGATALLAGGIGSQTVQAQNNHGIQGHEAPEIELDYWIDANGDPGDFSVQQARGKWVFLKCFQDWCPGCHSSGFPTLQQFSERFHDHPKVAIAAIQTVFEGFTSNTQEDVRKLQLRYELPITMGHDPGDEKTHARPVTMRAYRTGGTPWLILINPAGVVVFNNFHVDTGKLIEYVAEQVG